MMFWFFLVWKHFPLGFSLVFSFERFFSEISLVLFDLNLFSRATGNGLETDELGLGGLLACCGLCTLCVPAAWLSVIWNYFWWCSDFFLVWTHFPLGCSLVFSFERFFSEISLVLFDLNLFSRATGNGLETDELGLGGLLACCWLCALCAPTAWLSVSWKFFWWCSDFFWFENIFL